MQQNRRKEFVPHISFDLDGDGIVGNRDLVISNLFDKDGGGSITPDEIKNILFPGQNFDDEVWEKVVAEVDEDGNGHIDFEEFSRMMRSMVTSKDPEDPDDG